MSIQDILGKFKGILSNNELFTAFLVILVAVASFGLGRASVEPDLATNESKASVEAAAEIPKENPLKTPTSSLEKSEVVAPAGTSEVLYVASKSGTKYHLPWCPGAKQMKEENKVFFDSKAEAEAAGYTAAANCKGI